MKAIHNDGTPHGGEESVVYDPAKLVKMKAIHNIFILKKKLFTVVYDPAKLVKMKAIHNPVTVDTMPAQLFMTLQS